MKFIFEDLIHVPTEAMVLSSAYKNLESKLRKPRETQNRGEPVSISEITFTSESHFR